MKQGVSMLSRVNGAIKASVFRRLKNAWISFLPDQAGVSALEFSLFAPAILIGSLSVADVAFLAQQRMSLDQVLRAGAQQAMLDKSASPEAPDVVKVLNVMAAGNFAVGSTNAVNGKPPVILGASRYCVCPGNVTGPQVSCATICPNSKAPLAFYTVSAQSKSSNMILPNISFKPQITVQVR